MKALTPPSIAPPFARYAHGVEVPAGQRLVRTS
ncbi:MAG: RidA family protein, partial [Pseudomonadota bacterium]